MCVQHDACVENNEGLRERVWTYLWVCLCLLRSDGTAMSPQQMRSEMTGQHCSLSEHERERVCKILICSYLGYGGVVSLSLGSRGLMEESCCSKRHESKRLWQLPVAKGVLKLSLARSFSFGAFWINSPCFIHPIMLCCVQRNSLHRNRRLQRLSRVSLIILQWYWSEYMSIITSTDSCCKTRYSSLKFLRKDLKIKT